MAKERRESGFRFDLLDVIVLMVVASLFSLANGRPRVEPLRFSDTNGSMRIYLERSHVNGWPWRVYRWTPHDEAGEWFPRGIAGNVVVAFLIGAAALLIRRGIVRFIGFRASRASADER